MTRPALVSVLGSEFDDFLFAPIGEDRNDSPVSVLSALAQLDIDPWQEAAELAQLPGETATQRLASLMAALPDGPLADRDLETIAGRLIALLPRQASSNRYGPKYTIAVGVVTLAAGCVLFVVGSIMPATTGRLLQGAGFAVAFPGAVYLAVQGFPAKYLATAIGFTQMAGMFGGSAGQFLVAPILKAMPSWREFWIYAAILLVGLAVVLVLVIPRRKVERSPEHHTFASILSPIKMVLGNPQSCLCGIVAGLLFLPTTIGDMIWGVRFLQVEGVSNYLVASDRASMVPLGWVIGCPLLGYVADYLGLRKPVLIGGAILVLLASAAIVYLPYETPAYVGGFLLGLGSGAAMIPYSMIKETNPDKVKGSATGVMNFLVFLFSAFLAPMYGALLVYVSGGAKLTLLDFQEAGVLGIGLILLAIILAFFLKETGVKARSPASLAGVAAENEIRA